jgi:hypothetical protein
MARYTVSPPLGPLSWPVVLRVMFGLFTLQRSKRHDCGATAKTPQFFGGSRTAASQEVAVCALARSSLICGIVR